MELKSKIKSKVMELNSKIGSYIGSYSKILELKLDPNENFGNKTGTRSGVLVPNSKP
jgi:hypothetical protein